MVIFFEKSKIFQRNFLGNPGTKSTILVVQTASEPVIPLPRVLKAAKAGPAPRVNLVIEVSDQLGRDLELIFGRAISSTEPRKCIQNAYKSIQNAYKSIQMHTKQ